MDKEIITVILHIHLWSVDQLLRLEEIKNSNVVKSVIVFQIIVRAYIIINSTLDKFLFSNFDVNK